MVWKLDRLARSLKQLIETVELLSEREIGFRSLTENIDTTSSGGRLIFHVFGALARGCRGPNGMRTLYQLTRERPQGAEGYNRRQQGIRLGDPNRRGSNDSTS